MDLPEEDIAEADRILGALTFSKRPPPPKTTRSSRSSSFAETPHGKRREPRTAKTPESPSKNKTSPVRESISSIIEAVLPPHPTLKPFGDLEVGKPSKKKRQPPPAIYLPPDLNEQEPIHYDFSPQEQQYYVNPPQTPAHLLVSDNHINRRALSSSHQRSRLPSERAWATGLVASSTNYFNSLRSFTDPPPPRVATSQPYPHGRALAPPTWAPPSDWSIEPQLQAAPRSARQQVQAGRSRDSSVDSAHTLRPSDHFLSPKASSPDIHRAHNIYQSIYESSSSSGSPQPSPDSARVQVSSSRPNRPLPVASYVRPAENSPFWVDTPIPLPDRASLAPTMMSTENLLDPSSAQSGAFGASKAKSIAVAEKQQLIVLEKSKKLNIAPPAYKLLELCGKGSFGLVFKAKHQPTNHVVAVKMLNMDQMDQQYQSGDPTDAIKDLSIEITALKELRERGAKNVNIMLDAFVLDNEMWIVSEFCTGGSVHALMKARPQGLEERFIIVIARELAEAIKWVHDVGMIHRDIKSANVLISEDGSVQLCDFGVAALLQTKDEKRQTILGTPHWMAPELLSRNGNVLYGKNVDIWAFGCTLFEMATGHPPHYKVPHQALVSHLARHTPRLEGGNYSDALRDLVSLCLETDPTLRPRIDDVQKHIYVANTAKKYPTNSLRQLILDYKQWELTGGQRLSLFSAGGAQQMDLPSYQLGEDDNWDFGTRYSQALDSSAVTEDEDDGRLVTPQLTSRVPPSLQRLFYPDAAVGDFPSQWNDQKQRRLSEKTSNNQNRGRLSDLPLRTFSEPYPSAHQSVEIDLGSYDEQTGLSHFADNTIKGNAQSSRWFMGDDDDDSQTEEQAFENEARRATKDWTFPSMMMTSDDESRSLAPAAELRPAVSTETASAPSSPPRSAIDRDEPPRPSTASTDSSTATYFPLANRVGPGEAGNRGSFHKAWRSVPPTIDAGLTVEPLNVYGAGPGQLPRYRQASLSSQAESAFGRRVTENEGRGYAPSASRSAVQPTANSDGMTTDLPEAIGFGSEIRPLALRTQAPHSTLNGYRNDLSASSVSDYDEEYEVSDDENLFNIPMPAPPSQEALTEGATNDILEAELDRLLAAFNDGLSHIRTSLETVDRRETRAAARRARQQ